ncbi:hypothetical protein GF420_06790 [candidate division GN15 bacterium]|nr:hypothetical protein [candidate division GN15 bacterium]
MRYTHSESNLPPSFHQSGPSRLEIRDGGGVVSLFGLPFLAAGIFLILAGLKVIPFENADEVPGWLYTALVFGGMIFASVGGGIAFGRTWIVIEKAQGMIERRKGLLIPMRRDSINLREYQTVALTLETGDSDSPDQYPVVLASSTAGALKIVNGRDFATAYHQAVYLADFLQLPMEDRSTDHTRRLMPSEFRATMRDRLRREEVTPGHTDKPADVRSTVELTGSELQVTVPAKPFKLWRVLHVLAPMGFGFFLLLSLEDILDGSDTPDPVLWGMYGLLLLLLVIIPASSIIAALLRARLSYSRLTISAHELVIAERGIVRTRTQRVALADILDIDYHTMQHRRENASDAARRRADNRHPGMATDRELPPMVDKFLTWASKHMTSNGIIFKTRQGLLTFGAGLTEDEVAYLHGVIRDWLREH